FSTGGVVANKRCRSDAAAKRTSYSEASSGRSSSRGLCLIVARTQRQRTIHDDSSCCVRTSHNKEPSTMRLSIPAALAITFISTVQAAAGPISTLYLTDGDAGHLFIVNGNSQNSINTNAHGQEQYVIAVQKTVRIFSTYKDSGLNQGAEYTLAGVFTGVQ